MAKRNYENREKRNGGFTLVELLVSVAILAIIVVPIMTAFVSAANANSRARRKLEATTAAQNVMEAIKSSGVSAYLASITPAPTPAADGTYTLDNSNAAASGTALIPQQIINGRNYRFTAVFDPTAYTNPSKSDYNDVSVANISDMNVLKDAFYVESETDDRKIVNEYIDENSGFSEAEVLSKLQREIDIVIAHTGSLSKVTVNCKYSLTGYTDKTKTVSQVIYDNSDVNGGDLRSVYIFYTPLYAVKSSAVALGTSVTDNIVVENNTGTSGKESYPVNLYLVKQHTNSGKEAYESSYWVNLKVNELNTKPATGFSAYTQIRTNIGYSLVDGRALAQQLHSITYNWATGKSSTTLADCKTYLGLSTLDNSAVATRLYKITLSVYGESGDSALYTMTGTAES